MMARSESFGDLIQRYLDATDPAVKRWLAERIHYRMGERARALRVPFSRRKPRP